MNTSYSSLVPGYNQVDIFGPDEEYESEEEVEYVTLDLGTVEPALVPSSSSFRIIGLDTPAPFLQLSGTIFKGQHQNLLGTELLFTDAKDSDADRTRKSLIHVGTSERRIRFREVEVKAKTNDGPASATDQTPVKMLPKGKNNKKDRLPETVEEVVGSMNADVPRRRKGGRRAKDKGKGKEKAVEPADDEMDVDDHGEDRSRSILPIPAHEDAEDASVGAEGSALADVRSTSRASLVQWSSDAPEGSEHARMDVTE